MLASVIRRRSLWLPFALLLLLATPQIGVVRGNNGERAGGGGGGGGIAFSLSRNSCCNWEMFWSARRMQQAMWSRRQDTPWSTFPLRLANTSSRWILQSSQCFLSKSLCFAGDNGGNGLTTTSGSSSLISIVDFICASVDNRRNIRFFCFFLTSLCTCLITIPFLCFRLNRRPSCIAVAVAVVVVAIILLLAAVLGCDWEDSTLGGCCCCCCGSMARYLSNCCQMANSDCITSKCKRKLFCGINICFDSILCRCCAQNGKTFVLRNYNWLDVSIYIDHMK